MAHPKRKTSNTRKNKRRSHHKLKALALTKCHESGDTHLRHRVCMSSGYYRGRKIIEVPS